MIYSQCEMEKRCVFISHSKQDIAQVNPLIEQLKNNNYEVIRSSHSARGDAGYIDRAGVFIVCLSVNYSTEDSCHSEFLMLHWQEKPMVPVILDSVSWPPGDNLFIHRDFFWSLSSLLLDLSNGRGVGEELISHLNTALGTSTQQDDSWSVGARKSAPSPAALSSAQHKSRDESILAQLAAQSAEYQNLASAPVSVSGRDRSRSGLNSIDQSTSGRGRSAASRRGLSSAWTQDSRRNSLLTVTTVESSNEQTNNQNPQNVHVDKEEKSVDREGDGNQTVIKSKTNEDESLSRDKNEDTCDSSKDNLTESQDIFKNNNESNSVISQHAESRIKTEHQNNTMETTDLKSDKRKEIFRPKSFSENNAKKSKTCSIL